MPFEGGPVLIGAGDDDIDVTDAGAAEKGGLHLAEIASAVSLFVHLDLESVIGSVGNDVNHARYRVSTVNSGGAVCHDVHALDCHGGEQLLYITLHNSLAIDQGQRCPWSESSKIKVGNLVS